MARFSMLLVFFGRPSSRPHRAPQQYSVVRRCIGMLNSSAAARDFSTNSAPSTDLRISRPFLNSSSFMVLLLVDVGWLLFGPVERGQGILRGVHGDRHAL